MKQKQKKIPLLSTFVKMCELQDLRMACGDKCIRNTCSVIVLYSQDELETAKGNLLSVCKWMRENVWNASRDLESTAWLLCGDGSFECSVFGELIRDGAISKGEIIE